MKYSIKKNIIAFLEYTKLCKFKSIKYNRIFLIEQYFQFIKF